MNRLGYLSGAPRVSTRPQANEYGPASHVRGTIQGFRAAGWSVSPYIVGDLLPLGWVSLPGHSLRSNHFKRLGADVLRFAANGWHSRRAFRSLRGKVDWVYERYGAFQSLGRPFQRDGIPWILETNAPLALESGSEPGRRATSWRRALEKHEWLSYRTCDVLVVQTSVLKQILLQWAGIDPAKIFIVPMGVEAVRFCDQRPERKFSGPTIGFVGALRRWQALDRLLHAMARLGREGIEYNLVVVGDGERRREWRDLARELGLLPRVFFSGSQPWDRIPAWIAGFDLGFSGQSGRVADRPAYFSPLKLYEYMAAAKPVLASAHPDALELVAPGATGYLFAPDSQEDLEGALRRAWAERDLWPAMGEKAREIVAAGHTWEVRVRHMVDQIREHLHEREFRANG